ncbi:CoA transferase [Stutzerimonas kirkiae]|uniref:Carnitine dehydratase n=1 Tax=Stutzerimonas kirkiae TaxID=2211392 RepID=A0A4Q9R822_9GAMM|nr:CoA transferase [Stutzerimonas kirkiae]TBU96794.1 carnitine dehydratase [Stutzerimonas kirkiae]TBV01077.1 carnitine dehydratase [Stutzerimonas kirkiae]TBV08448.1 carnitine dehydratase [Stutzerimonas kirkiae]TBV16936.1 carnitine dehydratase [Stutzerimonas kirkiae]
MPTLLNEFSLLHSGTPSPPNWNALSLCLMEQARLLGIRQPSGHPAEEMGSAAFVLRHPAISAIQGHYVSPGAWLPTEQLSETLLQAASGIMSVHGRASGKAQALGLNYLATLTAAMTLQATLAAAVGQLRGGAFQQVRVSPLECGLLSIGQYLAGATAAEDREQFLPGGCDARSRPPFRSADGITFELETLDSTPWRHFWTSAGIAPELAGTAWKSFLLRYARAISPLPAACLQALARLPYTQILHLAAQAGVAVVPLRTLAQRQADADYQQSRGTPWNFERSSASGTPHVTPAPTRLPLQGLRVVESCRRIQGPLAGHLLALLGAEVIRLEPPGGDPLRAMPPCAEGCSVRFDALNQLKSIQEVDIKSAQGRQAIHQLVREADVFLHNWAPGKAREMRLDAEHLHRVQPQLVYAYAGGWGPAPVNAPGTDFTVQAWSGVADAIATSCGTHGGSLFTVLDVLGGVLATLGVTAALLDRTVTGSGTHVESSLLGAADLLLRSSPPTPANGLSDVYPTQSGLIAIDCQHPEQQRALAMLLDIPAPLGNHLEQLRQHLLTHPAAHWESALNAQGIGACVVVEDLAQLARDARIAGCLDHKAYSSVNSPWSFL